MYRSNVLGMIEFALHLLLDLNIYRVYFVKVNDPSHILYWYDIVATLCLNTRDFIFGFTQKTSYH